MGPARGRRLLDARRLRELGHRARLRALAPDEEARAHAAGAHRRRRDRELQPSREWGAWTKWLLDRSLAWYDAETAVAGRLPDPVAFGVDVTPQSDADAALAGTRIAANAARAVAAGLGTARAVRPPALYAYDPDTGRLAVTTPNYSTAIIAVNQRAFPYGGVDLARLLDGRGRVAANVGGQAPASFGMVVRDSGDRVVLASQQGRAVPGRTVSPLRLVKAPEGVGARAATPARAGLCGPLPHPGRHRDGVAAPGTR